MSDMARFVSFEMGYGPETVLNKKVLLESQSQMFWTDEGATTGYGLGLMLVRKGDTVGLGHGGSVAGFLAGAYFDPSSHLGIIFLRNAEGHGFDPQFIVGLLGQLKAGAPKVTRTHLTRGSPHRLTEQSLRTEGSVSTNSILEGFDTSVPCGWISRISSSCIIEGA